MHSRRDAVGLVVDCSSRQTPSAILLGLPMCAFVELHTISIRAHFRFRIPSIEPDSTHHTDTAVLACFAPPLPPGKTQKSLLNIYISILLGDTSGSERGEFALQ